MPKNRDTKPGEGYHRVTGIIPAPICDGTSDTGRLSSGTTVSDHRYVSYGSYNSYPTQLDVHVSEVLDLQIRL